MTSEDSPDNEHADVPPEPSPERPKWTSTRWMVLAYACMTVTLFGKLHPHSALTLLLFPAALLLLVGGVRSVVELVWPEERGRVHPALMLVLAVLPFLVFLIIAAVNESR